MEWVETTGRTVEEALDAALDELGVHEEDVEFEVLEEPRGGFLSRFGTGARIRARVRPISREKPGDRERRSRRATPGRATHEGPRTTTEPAGLTSQPTGVPAVVDVAGGLDGRTGTRRRRRRRRNGSHQQAEERPAAAQVAERPSEGAPVEPTNPAVPIEDQADAAREFVQGLVDAFELGARVSTAFVDDGILIDVEGPGLGLLVGPRGATLQAVEELVRTVVQRRTDGHGARINVDVGGYRAKRRAALEAFTREVAQRVLDTGRPQALEPMPPADRKIVHDTAAAIEGVATESRGEEPRRRVVLIPVPPARAGVS